MGNLYVDPARRIYRNICAVLAFAADSRGAVSDAWIAQEKEMIVTQGGESCPEKNSNM